MSTAAVQPTLRRKPYPLAARIALLAAAISLLTAIVGGGLAIGLVKRSATQNGQQTLAKLADAAAATADEGASAQAGQLRARQELAAIDVQVATVNARGVMTARGALAQAAATNDLVSEAESAGSVSTTAVVRGVRVLVEARRTDAGAIVLVQRRSDAVRVGDRAVRLIGFALAGAVAVSILVSLLVTWRLARPLKRTAQAAHLLAEGRRDIRVEPEGPAEMVDVAVALNTLTAHLSRSEARQREFLLTVSHDLRTPLTAITGFAESLADGVVTEAEVGRVGGVMLDESRRLERMIADLLDLARLDSTEFRLDFTDVRLAEWLALAAEVWRRRCADAGPVFTLDDQSGAVVLRTDPARLRQIVDGLLENALRVTPPGAPITLSARLAAAVHGQPGVVIEVSDGGPGLTEDDFAVAFDRSVLFHRYRGIRQVGTGLGLAIVKGLTLRLGGQVEAGRSVHAGARFSVWLPLAPLAPRS